MASMRDWLKGIDAPKDRVVVVHCKAGKGRSGTVACSYLISEEGWAVKDALERFTARRMRSGFGAGVGIPSQLRWVSYVDHWAKSQKLYVERQIEILELHVWGLRDGVKVAVEGYIEEGRTIRTFHIFNKHERHLVDGTSPSEPSLPDAHPTPKEKDTPISASTPHLPGMKHTHTQPLIRSTSSDHLSGAPAVLFRPSAPLILPTSDINIDFERRNKATYGWTMVTAVAHVWFNAFFESRDPENNSDGVFEIEWDAMDGIKGSARKGTRALDRLAVVWRAIGDGKGMVVGELREGQPVPETGAADWKGANEEKGGLGKDLGLRTESPVSANVSKASSVKSGNGESVKGGEDGSMGVKVHRPSGEDHIPHVHMGDGHASEPNAKTSESELAKEEGVGDVGMSRVAGIVASMKDVGVAEVDKAKAVKDEQD